MPSSKYYRIQLPDGSWFSTCADGIYHFTALVNGKLGNALLVSPKVVEKSIKENKQLIINN